MPDYAICDDCLAAEHGFTRQVARYHAIRLEQAGAAKRESAKCGNCGKGKYVTLLLAGEQPRERPSNLISTATAVRRINAPRTAHELKTLADILDRIGRGK